MKILLKDIESLIIEAVREECLRGYFPDMVIINIDEVIMFGEGGEYLNNPSFSDMVENEYNEIITRHYYGDEYQDEYIKFHAVLSELNGIKAEYKITVLQKTPLLSIKINEG